MKIIHVTIGKANPERLNGINKVVHHLASYMMKDKQDVEVWGLTKTPESQTPKRDYPLHLFETSARSFALNPLVAEAVDALPAGAVIHFHGGFIPAFYRLARYLDKKKIAWVMSPHGAYMAQSLQKNYFIKNVYLALCEKYLLRKAKAIHALTHLEHQAIQTVCNKAIVATVPNAHTAEPRETRKVLPEIYAHARPVFCYMGRLNKTHKGLDLLLDGFADYKQGGGQGELWLIGDGPHLSHLEQHAAKRHMTQYVRFWGTRYDEEKINILKNANVFVHTSRWEGMPMALLEAAAQGLPVLISTGTGLARDVEKWKAGLVLEHNTASDIAKAMLHCQQLHKLGKLRDMGLQAADMVKTDFNWQVVVQTMTDTLYKAA